MASTKLQTERPNILITGATDGIGLALARRYQAENANLILVGRRPLSQLDPGLFNAANYCQVDLAQVDAADRVAVWLECANLRRLDQVYLNAATSFVGDIGDHSPQHIEQMVRVNLWTPIALVHRLAPLVAPQRGRFIFVSAVTAATPTPDYAVYTATKAALEGFVRSLRMELRAQGSPIRMTLARPGATHTGLHAKSGADPMRLDWSRFPPAEQTAAALHRAVQRKRRTTNLGAANSLLYWAGRSAAGLITAALRRRLPPAAPSTPDPAVTNVSKPHIVITGSAAVAQSFVTGYNTESGTESSVITLVDSHAAALQTAAAALRATGAQVNTIQADLSTLEGCAAALHALAAGPPISIWINNAEISSVGPFLASELGGQERVLAVNLLAPMLLTAGLLHNQQFAPGASLVFRSSLSHFIGCPGAAVYAATKDGIASFAQSLAAAAHPADRHVLTVYASPVHAPFNSGHAPSHASPQLVAAAIRRAIARRRRSVIPGLPNHLAVALARLFPPFVDPILARALFSHYTAPTVAPDTNTRTQK